MAIAIPNSFSPGTTAESAKVNENFSTIADAGMDLISPADDSLDMNGHPISGLAAGSVSAPGLAFTSDSDTGVYRSAADTVDVAAGGVRAARFNTVASGVNFADITPSATGNAVQIAAAGSDTNIDLDLDGKGTGINRASPAGMIVAYGGATAPTGWLLCDGAAVSRATYARLFAVLGETFGAGDASTTFNVPDLRGRFPLGQDDMGGSAANRVTAAAADTVGSASGAEAHTAVAAHTHTGTTASDGAHTHDVTVSTTGGGAVARVAGVTDSFASTTIANAAVSSGAHTHTFTTASTGDASVTHMNPYLTVNYIVKW